MAKIVKKTKEFTRRAVVIATLLALLVFSLATLSFAWYRNYVDIEGMKVTTGKISFDIEKYDVMGDLTVTGPQIKTIDGETASSVVLNSDVTTIKAWAEMPHHVYYFIKNPIRAEDTSIDLDASIALSLDNTTIPEEIGGVRVSISQVKLGELTDFEDADGEMVRTTIENLAKSGGIQVSDTEKKIAFSDLQDAYREFSVKRGEYVCLRISYELPANLSTFQNLELGVRVSFCLAQKGGLPTDNPVSEYVVYTEEGLQAALGKYRPNDTIIIKGNIDYIGDLVFNRPLYLSLQNADLTVYGNLIYAYPYQGHFTLDTSKGGRLLVVEKAVVHIDEEGNETYDYVGGDFEINMPKAQIEMVGKNNKELGRGDVYVQNDFVVAASKSNAGSSTCDGLILNNVLIFETSGTAENDKLKTVTVASHTKITVLNYTTLGSIVAQNESSVVEIENHGTIEAIDLSQMFDDGSYTKSEPQIFIDNYGDLVQTEIKLPQWAKKFGLDGEGNYEGNTRIVSNPAAGHMTTNDCSGGFESDGLNGENDDIEYVELNTFIEKVNNLDTEIVVQYTDDTKLYKPSSDVKIGSTLQTLIEYYSGVTSAASTPNGSGTSVHESLKIAMAGDITSMKIVCLNNTMLTDADYKYIRTNMKQLRTLDLSDATSINTSDVEKCMPYEALNGMTALTTLHPSRYDTKWENKVLSETGVKEIWLSPSLIEVGSSSLKDSNLQYIHTATTKVVNLSAKNHYIFVPDQETYNDYQVAGKVFMDATRYSTSTADYFLRINESDAICELVTIIDNVNIGSSSIDLGLEKASTAKFDFATVTIANKVYTIVSYDPYAFYDRKFINVTEIAFGEELQRVQPYAFYKIDGLTTITFKGETTVETAAFDSCGCSKFVFEQGATIQSNAFQNSTATEFHGENITRLEKYALGSMGALLWVNLPSLRYCEEPFNNSNAIMRADIGVLDVGSLLFGSKYSGVRYLFLHTDENDIVPNYTLTGQNTSSRIAFLPSSHQALFTALGSLVILDSGLTVADIKEYYDPNNIVKINGLKFPNFIYTEKADETVKLIASFAKQLEKNEDVFKIPGVTISEIGGYAYAYTSLYFRNEDLIMPTSVKKIGHYAFTCYLGVNNQTGASGTKTSEKYYRNLNFSDVEELGICSFVANTCVTIVGEKVHTIDGALFARNTTVISISLPALRNTLATGYTYVYYFSGCNNLRMLLLGPADQTVKDWGLWLAENIELVIINDSDYKAGYPSNWFAVYNEDDKQQPVPALVNLSANRSVNGTYFNIKDLIVCGYQTYTVTLGGVSYSVNVPTMLYSKNGDGTVTLRKYMHDRLDSGDTYTVPSTLIDTKTTMNILGKNVPVYQESMKDDGTFKVNTIATRAFRAVTYTAQEFNTGKYVTTLNKEAFMCTFTIKRVVLESVETIESKAFYKNSTIESVVGNSVETIGDLAFSNCTGLKSVSFPLVETIGSSSFYKTSVVEWDLPMLEEAGSLAFSYNPSLLRVSFGENLQSLGENALIFCGKLEEVVFRGETMVEVKPKGSNNLFDNDDKKEDAHSKERTRVNVVRIIVREGVLDQYTAEATWQKIPSSSFTTFELFSENEDKSITFYYELIDEEKGEVMLSFMRMTNDTLKGTFTFPDSFTETTTSEDGGEEEKTYRITRISDGFWRTIAVYTEITEYVLPTHLETIVNDFSVISPTLRAMVFAGENAVYSTENGVLYNKNKTLLLYYPKGKIDASFTVGASVTMIAERAFAGNESLESVTIEGNVIVGLGAFEGCKHLKSVIFTSETPSYFAGTGIFAECSRGLTIYVPTEEAAELYKQAVLFDVDLVNRIKVKQDVTDGE